jgi:hypothetical protein
MQILSSIYWWLVVEDVDGGWDDQSYFFMFVAVGHSRWRYSFMVAVGHRYRYNRGPYGAGCTIF